MMRDASQKAMIWQVQFETGDFLHTLPAPNFLGEEVETTPDFVQDGAVRTELAGGRILITLEGEGAVRISGKEYALTPGKVLLHRQKDPNVCCYYPPHGRKPWRFLWFAMKGGNLCEIIEELVHSFGYVYHTSLTGELVQKLRSFRGKGRQVRFLSSLEGAELVFSAFRMLCVSEEMRTLDPANRLVCGIQSVIASEYQNELNTAELASRFGVSREHLSRVFNRETGMTLRECFLKVRMRTAADLLNHTTMTSKEVALKCGFGGYPAFFRAFKRYFKISPDKFREKKGLYRDPAGDLC